MKGNLSSKMIVKVLKKVVVYEALGVITIALLSGCTKEPDNKIMDMDSMAIQIDEQTKENYDNGQDENNSQNLDMQTSAGDDKASSEEKTGKTFEDISKSQFEFSSGAGGWSTELTVEKDGHFSGNYHDSDYGDSAANYKDGTVYSSVFSGQFNDLVKLDEYTYEFSVQSIKYENEINDEEIVDGIRYIYTDAYGLVDGEKFLLHCPGKALSELNEDVHSWIDMAVGDGSVLDFYVIENVQAKNAFYSSPRMEPYEDAQMNYDNYKRSYEYYLDILETKDMKQLELNDTAQKMYENTDYCLNYIWNLVRYNLDESDYQKILVEQREWISHRDETVKNETEAYKDGSIYGLIYFKSMAKLTIERCGELVEALK